jgi:hypothetical protein
MDPKPSLPGLRELHMPTLMGHTPGDIDLCQLPFKETTHHNGRLNRYACRLHITTWLEIARLPIAIGEPFYGSNSSVRLLIDAHKNHDVRLAYPLQNNGQQNPTKEDAARGEQAPYDNQQSQKNLCLTSLGATSLCKCYKREPRIRNLIKMYKQIDGTTSL